NLSRHALSLARGAARHARRPIAGSGEGPKYLLGVRGRARVSTRQRLITVHDALADDGLRLQAHHSAWSTSTFAGAPTVAREHCEAGRSLYDPERHRSHRLLYGGHDPN